MLQFHIYHCNAIYYQIFQSNFEIFINGLYRLSLLTIMCIRKMWVVCAYECMTKLRILCQGPINIEQWTQVFTYFQRKSSDLLIRVKGAKKTTLRYTVQGLSCLCVDTPLKRVKKVKIVSLEMSFKCKVLGTKIPTDFDHVRPPKEVGEQDWKP